MNKNKTQTLPSGRLNKTPLLLAMMIIATGQVGVSIYLPSLPLISQDLGVSSSDVQLLVTLFLVGFGGSQLFYGPLSDALGRRPIFILGQGIYLLGTVLCFSMTDNFTVLVFGRLLQGLGAGSASVLGRSVLRDSYSGYHLTKAMSYISITASILPILSPVIGGWIAWHFSWQWVFGFVLIYLMSILAIGYFILPETLPYKPQKFSFGQTLRDYGSLVGNAQVISSASLNWVSYLSSLVSVSLLPFLLQDGLGLTAAEYGQVMIIPSAGLMIGSFILNSLNKRCSVIQLMGIALGIMTISGLSLVILETSLFSLVFGFTLLAVAQGISTPLSINLLLAPHTKKVGTISALSGSVQMCLAGLLGGYLVKYWVVDQNSLGFFYLVITMTMLFVLLWNKQVQSESGK
ncbi:multidrug effflux MFS transporter [Aliivibrio sp. S4TY2]|uniref:multidrug effflux MFS transporter n=1 Tax=unclassified Aliivibrio TaxID=2645654 RepID=UPI002378887F|nr:MULTISPECIES: multidrug effflux MFS transporter [unclassified Aliivibrio]MDD9156328.1 multidrug effflux MFS transporter [Aliivibrio sp. S4TY2]MDD9160675.1 multidrug effflux MFS transporter [Aliivibrio sp. S4TY1]MDD9164036.1 multidrug effflux MFS transporter [Aliivibrio sp. S4MY2]MDD9167990.1 multidrug effflux MFS transporter [Aliivibrio sp. S4MY4]MDD9185232.1 multidrug effflux MFS transporter [Aliivibrio sp. S4MY3]